MRATIPCIFVSLVFAMTRMADAQTGAPASRPATAPSASNSIDDARALMAEGKYEDALRGIGRLLGQPRGGGGAPQDRQALLLLRAECQLQLKQPTPAISALDQLIIEAEQSGDINAKSQAIALKTLVLRSSAFVYTSRSTQDKKVLNILDSAARPAAYAALLVDEIAQLHVRQSTARQGGSLNPMLEISRSFSAIEAIERTATGATRQTDELASELSQWAIDRINARLVDLDAQVRQYAKTANQPAVPGASVYNGNGRSIRGTQTSRKGLSDSETQALQSIVAECKGIEPAVTEMNRAFTNTGLLNVASDAKTVAERANLTLEGNYTAVLNGKGPTPPPPARSGRRGAAR